MTAYPAVGLLVIERKLTANLGVIFQTVQKTLMSTNTEYRAIVTHQVRTHSNHVQHGGKVKLRHSGGSEIQE